MKHARKMFLVPEDVFNSIQRKNEIQTSPSVKVLSSLNQEMNKTLDNEDIPPEFRMKNYSQMLQRYLDVQDQREKYIPTVKVQNQENASNAGSSEQSASNSNQPEFTDADILGTVPKKYRNEAQGLLNWVKKNPQAIRWDNKGEISINGNPVLGSHISDLINDAVRSRKGIAPTGRDAFTETLAKINTPETFIRNEDRRRFMSTAKHGLPPLATPVSTMEKRLARKLPTPPSTPKKARSKQPASRKIVPRKGLDWVTYD